MPHRLVVFVSSLLFAVASMMPQAAHAQTRQCFDVPAITNCIAGRFLEYWRDNGGLAAFGYPIGPVTNEINPDDKQVYPTQWFERNRFELHADNARPYDVLLGRLGADRLVQLGRNWQAEPREAGPKKGCLWFAETGHNVCDQQPGTESAGLGFRVQWEGYYGTPPCNLDTIAACYPVNLAFYGLPLTAVHTETNSSGDTVEVQWFERARFEWHPDLPDQYKVLLGLLGNEVRAH